MAKSAKIVLKDLVKGDLLLCTLRPDFDFEKHGDIPYYQIYDNTPMDYVI